MRSVGLGPLFCFMDNENVGESIRRLLEGAVEGDGYELVCVQFLARESASVLRIYIDKDGGVGISDCQRVSRKVSTLLDVEDLIPNRYTLEVSSPGLERPLCKASDYERFAGQEIKIRTSQKVDERHNFCGMLQGIAREVISIECDSQIHRIPIDLVARANLVCQF